MSFIQRYKSPELMAIMRDPGEPLRASKVQVELDFSVEDGTDILPPEGKAGLDEWLAGLFDGKFCIAQEDPYADNFVNLKRLKGAAIPVLFEHGTTGAGLSFFIARWVEDWLKRQKWNRDERVMLTYGAVILDDSAFIYTG